jgi:hypothetical protein
MQPSKSRADSVAVILLLILTIAAVVWCYWVAAPPADAAPGDIELRAYKPLAPDVNLSVGAGIAVELGQVPATWPLFPDRLVFIDGLTVRGKYAVGASVSRRPAAEDDQWRLWVAAWEEDGFQGTFGLAYGYPLDLGGF